MENNPVWTDFNAINLKNMKTEKIIRLQFREIKENQKNWFWSTKKNYIRLWADSIETNVDIVYPRIPVKPEECCLAHVCFLIINNLYLLVFIIILSVIMATPLFYNLFWISGIFNIFRQICEDVNYINIFQYPFFLYFSLFFFIFRTLLINQSLLSSNLQVTIKPQEQLKIVST